ncbi:hypothetical protein Pmar_PMAR009827 [Perkinsus marinus ATCC 50983]|uniref:Peptidase A1 domain-containing protein n=1 Tax=Perkinsus marinus (strain ATCC 50983 / TXsc) TaxID=423536 RepID=C5KV67_PERM5|nr:hypothetical protein Pmar_PMAR009827 [Perkinsus marinus ATCC 50983]EER11613.1 hypothetical protein Pmar_PMAR009827 [Perkinsus marinus ATCC 50983]|eukprot:XP_002779818.1 hypothetical protein Pmar_PMAR009827 [Perkinsus marinus ATCC 50983]
MAVNDNGILDTGAECIFIPMHRYTLPNLIKDLETRSSNIGDSASTSTGLDFNSGQSHFQCLRDWSFVLASLSCFWPGAIVLVNSSKCSRGLPLHRGSSAAPKRSFTVLNLREDRSLGRSCSRVTSLFLKFTL